MYSDGLHKSVKKYYKSKETVKELYKKDMQENHQIYDEILKLKANAFGRKGDVVEEVDKLAVTGSMDQLESNWLTRYLSKASARNKIGISKDIEEMPYEQRKKLEQEALGNSIAVNYNSFPFKALSRKTPQFFRLDGNKIRNDSDTAQLVDMMASDEHKKNESF